MGGAGDVAGVDAEQGEGVADGTGGASGAEDKGGGVPGLEKGLEGLAEGRGVGIVADEAALSDDDAVDGTDGFGLGGKGVELRDDGYLVRDGDIEAGEVLLGGPGMKVVGETGELA